MTETNHLSERSARIEKLDKIKKSDIEPYPSQSIRTQTCGQAIESFDNLSSNGTKINLTGRLRLIRQHGSLTFAQLEDESAKIQLLFKKDLLGANNYHNLPWLDIGDFLQVEGSLIKTKTGEITLQVTGWALLSKALRPLPEKWHGLKDQEERFRRRYVDLIVNPETKQLFRKRSLFIKEIRRYLDNRGFLEVETPILEAVPGGAEAAPFITHHNTLDMDLYLRISLELHLKRLSVGGFEKIYELGRIFRNEGMSPQHLQEITELEFYWEYADYRMLMELVENFYAEVIGNTFGSLKFEYQGQQINFTPPWPRIDYYQLVKDNTKVDLSKITSVDQLREEIKKRKIQLDIEPYSGLGRIIDQLYKKTSRPQIIQPSFLIDHPVAVSPLAKRKISDPSRVERLQVLFMGAEVGNGFSELNDPLDQRARFEEQMRLREAGDTEAQMLDEDFLQALEYGLPPTAGFGVGIDRWLMYLVNASTIREVVFFPLMRPKDTEV